MLDLLQRLDTAAAGHKQSVGCLSAFHQTEKDMRLPGVRYRFAPSRDTWRLQRVDLCSAATRMRSDTAMKRGHSQISECNGDLATFNGFIGDASPPRSRFSA
jgi:hypothetical protein